jgi:hypothetical protein
LSKTLPDYKRLEENRAKQAKLAATGPLPKLAQKGANYWTSFRGPNRDGHYDEKPLLLNSALAVLFAFKAQLGPRHPRLFMR